MTLWGKNDSAANAPKNKHAASPKAAANGQVAYANTTVGALNGPATATKTTGIFAVDAGTQHNLRTGKKTKGAGPGWQKVSYLTGPLTSLNANAAGSGYSNTDYVIVSAPGAVNANCAVTTNATGAIVSLTVTNPGKGFANVSTLSTSVKAAGGGASAGSGATFFSTLGGKAGRRQIETLVAMRTTSGNTSGSTL